MNKIALLILVLTAALLASKADASDIFADTSPPTRVSGAYAKLVNIGVVELNWAQAYDDFTRPSDLSYEVYRAELKSDASTTFTAVARLRGLTKFTDRLFRRGYYVYYIVASDESRNLASPSAVVNVTN
jgi:hypothetical protein